MKVVVLLHLCAFVFQVAAQSSYEPVASLRQRITHAPTDSARCVAWIHLANTYIEENKIDSCRWAAEQAIELANRAKLSAPRAWAEFFLGAYYFYEGNYDRGIAVEQKVIRAAEQMKSPLLRANAQKMVAWMYTEMGKEKEALALFYETMPVFKKYRWDDLQMNVGIGYYGIATCFYYLGDFRNAQLFYDSAIRAKPPMDAREFALTLADRAALVRDWQQRPAAALPDNLRALNMVENLPLHQDAQAYVQAELAMTYAVLGESKSATKWVNEAYRLYQTLPFLKRYVSVCAVLAETFHVLGNDRQAFLLERETRALEDSIYKWRKIQVVEEMRTRYETAKMDETIAQLNKKQLLQESIIIRNNTALLLLVGFLAVLVTLGLVFYRKREKYHRRIRELEGAEKVRIEKERISKELHDSLGSQLSTISFGLQRAVRETQYGPLQTIQSLTDNVTTELRDFIWANGKGSLTIEELQQRINNLFLQVRQTNPAIQLELDVQENAGEVELSPDVGLHLFRIVQESINNTLKHAQAKLLTVRLAYSNQRVHLEVNDDGVGFEWPISDDQEHFGIANMSRRAIDLNGSFELTTAPRAGTRITVTMPNKLY